MPLLCLFLWFKSILRRDDAKALPKDAKALPKDAYWKSLTQEVDDKLLIISVASTRVSSIAARGIQDAIKAQARASTASTMALCAAQEFSECTKTPLKIVADIERRARDAAKNAGDPTKADRLVATDLKTIAARLSRWADATDANARNAIGKIDRAEGRYAGATRSFKASNAAAFAALADITRTIADIVEAHSITITRMDEPAPPIKELLLGIHLATAQAAFDTAKTVKVVNRELPPPYKERSS